MTYSTDQNLIDQFGEEEIAQITHEGQLVDGTLLRLTIEGGDVSTYTAEQQAAAIDAQAAIAVAIDNADGIIDSYISVVVTLPLAVATPNAIRAASMDIARYRLYDDAAPEEIRRRYDDALRYLRDIAAGKATLGIDTATSGVGSAEGTTDDDDRIFTMATLQDY